MDSSKRVDSIDIFKALCIIFMIMGHIGFGMCFDKYIHAFHMPTFFIVSGLFFNNQISFKKFLSHKFKSLIVPYIIWSMFFEVLGYFTGRLNLYSIIWNNINDIPIAGALWFLTAMFGAELLVYILLRFFNEYISVVLMIILSVIVQTYSIKLPFSFDSSITGAVFILLGYSFKQKFPSPQKFDCINHNKKNVAFLIMISLINIVLIFINGYTNMRVNQYGYFLLFILNAFIAFVCYEFWIIFLLSKNIRIIRLVKRILITIGKYSITYLCFNQLIIMMINKLFIVFLIGNNMLEIFPFNILTTCVTIILCYFINNLFMKSRMKILLGK